MKFIILKVFSLFLQILSQLGEKYAFSPFLHPLSITFFPQHVIWQYFCPRVKQKKYTPLLLLNRYLKNDKNFYNRFKYFLKQANNYNDHSKFRAYQVQICQNKKLIDDDDNVNDDD